MEHSISYKDQQIGVTRTLSELKPCKYCGGSAVLRLPFVPDNGFARCMCSKCKSDTQLYDTRDEAIEAWNAGKYEMEARIFSSLKA